MNFRLLLIAALSLASCAMYGCGSQGGGGSDGANGNLTLATTVTGPVVMATATYTNPDTTITNLSGVPITFATSFGPIPGTYPTNSSGSASVPFTPPPFVGATTFVVSASTGNLQSYSTVPMTGITMTMTAPPAQTVALTGAGIPGNPYTFIFSSPTFVTIADPFNNNISNHKVNMTASFSVAPSAVGDLLTFGATNAGAGGTATATAITGPSGTVPMPGTSLALTIPAVGNTRTATIAWTAVVDLADPDPVFRGLAASGATVVTLTN